MGQFYPKRYNVFGLYLFMNVYVTRYIIIFASIFLLLFLLVFLLCRQRKRVCVCDVAGFILAVTIFIQR